jgi:hypothetical protein
MKMLSTTLTPILLGLFMIIGTSAQTTAKPKDIKSIWKLDFSGLSVDPSSWSEQVKTKALQAGSGAAYIAFLGASLTVSAVWFIGLYGFVSLNWVLVFLTSAAYYGYVRGGRLMMLASSLAAYCYAFGMFTV